MDHTYEGAEAPFTSPDDIKSIVAQKARELFLVCDVEQKGFVSKRDMQRLVSELPLQPDQLEEVFDSLDDDKNGYLTLEEFTEGFGGFLGLNHGPIGHDEPEDADEFGDDHDQDYLEREYELAMNSIGATGAIAEHDAVKELWKKLHQDEPGMVGQLEDFIQHVCTDIRTAQLNTGELEAAMKNRDSSHQEDIKNLYEEMERQIRMERERILAEERERERRVKEQLETDLRTKDDQLHSLLKKQSELERKVYELSLMESEVKEENESLQERNDELAEKLDQTERNLKDSKNYLKEIQERIRKEKRERAQNNVRVAQGIMKERESLFDQLDHLKSMNQQLQDDHDMRLQRAMSDPSGEASKQQGALVKQGSIMSNYFEEGVIGPDGGISQSVDGNHPHSWGEEGGDGAHGGNAHDSALGSTLDSNHSLGHNRMHHLGGEEEEDCEVDDAFLESSGLLSPVDPSTLGAEEEYEVVEGDYDEDVVAGRNSAEAKRRAFNRKVVGGRDEGREEGRQDSESSGPRPEGQRADPVGAHTQGPVDQAVAEAKKLVAANRSPERLFKVVFVGDSGVGKTSIIHRFCTDSFSDSFCATIGVDFQVKSLTISGNIVAMQLWDTAGQERFRSITRHYFRKADGIVVIYDVTSERSFLNVRNWMTSVEETTDDHIVKMLLGNKCDCSDKVIAEETGHSLAETYKCDFYEVSAKSGSNVVEAFTAMSKLLLVKEDEEMQNALKLAESDDQKKKCCDS
ncbi:EF-hand calcium-binding domain-containing protein 4B-like [Diadema setosum]|uniref:EF-hand calcium-binding domain-containing protein 4B-like n=1 Tax=Diadema setosum TaxID=31175 RepID=UPI003B3B8C43